MSCQSEYKSSANIFHIENFNWLQLLEILVITLVNLKILNHMEQDFNA